MRPHCEHFRPSAIAEWLCSWWDSEIDEPGIVYFCSLPAWEEKICETRGQRNIPEDALSGPVGVNVARLLGVKLPPPSPDELLAQRVGELDRGIED